MIDWKKCSDAMPDDQQQCILYSEENDAVAGPLPFRSDMKGWLDFFATPEAGTVYTPEQVSHWAPWNPP